MEPCQRSINFLPRSVKASALTWQMADVMWMFENNEDVDPDVSMMLELRTDVNDMVKSSEKILSGGRVSEKFQELLPQLKQAITNGKVHFGTL